MDCSEAIDNYTQLEAAKKQSMTEAEIMDIQWMLERFDDIMNRKPILMNAVKLDQNPHNVTEWHNLVMLYENEPHKIVYTYIEAIETVKPELAAGKLHTLWIAYALFYEKNGQIKDARDIFRKGTQVAFASIDELESVWCEWAEMEVRQGNIMESLELMKLATTIPCQKSDSSNETRTVQLELHKSLKIWLMYADLEERYGTFETCKSVYEKIIQLNIATPQTIISYGNFLHKNNYFEKAVRAYEEGLTLFRWPEVYDIWVVYLTKFCSRNGNTNLARCRNLFERCLKGCLPEYANSIFSLYVEFEEKYGLPKHVLPIYVRAIRKVLSEERFDIFKAYIKKAGEIYGIASTRPIYEQAIEVLNVDKAQEMCFRFAEVETTLGKIDRARALYSHGSKMSDPRISSHFWQVWKDFEVCYGNEETMKEMNNIKDSIQAMYDNNIE